MKPGTLLILCMILLSGSLQARHGLTELLIVTEPAGAAVTIGGSVFTYGVSPLTLELDACQPYQACYYGMPVYYLDIMIAKPGFQPQRQTICIPVALKHGHWPYRGEECRQIEQWGQSCGRHKPAVLSFLLLPDPTGYYYLLP